MSKFTTREKQIHTLLKRKGYDRKQIADELVIKIRTVDSHIRHMHSKTGTRSLQGLAAYEDE